MISRRLNEVRRLLWRWEWGWSRAAEVEEALRRELGRLSSERNLSVGFRHRLRGLPEVRYQDQEAAMDRALRCLRSVRYREAFQHLCTAETLVRRLNRTAATYEERRRARTRWGEMVARLSLQPFADLLSLAVVPRLHRETEELLDHGEERKARFVLGVAEEAMTSLESACGDGEWRRRLTRRLEVVNPSPPLYSRLRELLANGRHKLTESLLLDLEIRSGGGSAEPTDDDLSAALLATAARADRLRQRLQRIAS